MDIERVRKQLNDMLTELDSSAGTLREQQHQGNDELADYDQHPADAATALTDADRDDVLIEGTQQRRARVREALQRIEDGAYGYCVNCGRRMSDERLGARPEVALCLQCEEQLEAES